MNKKLFLFVLILLGIMALLVGGRFFYFLFFIVLLILSYSYVSVRNVGKQLVGLCWLNTYKIERDKSVKIDFKLCNGSILPAAYMEIGYNVPAKLSREIINNDVLTLSPLETIKFKKEIKCQRRGIYHLGNIKITISDIFGIVNKTTNIEDEVILTVYPKIYELSNFKVLGNESYGMLKSNVGYDEDYSSIKDIRKYYLGDSIKRINWKVTAKRGQLYVKNYDIYNNVKIKLYLDFELDKYSSDDDGAVEEKIIECAISITKHSLTRNIPIELATYTDSRVSMYGKNLNSLNDFLELTATIKPVKDISLKDAIDFEKNLLSLSDTIIIITPKVDEKLVTLIISLKKKGYSITLISVSDSKKKHNWYNNLEILEKLGIESYRLGINDDLNSTLR